MLGTIAVIFGVFAFVGWLILNSKEAKQGDAGRNRKTLYRVFAVALVCVAAVSLIPALVDSERAEAQVVGDRVLSEYSSEIQSATFVRSEGPTTLGVVGAQKGEKRGRYRYHVVDIRGNSSEWIVDWMKDENGIQIVRVSQS